MQWKTIPWFMTSGEIHWNATGTKLILVLGRLKAKKTINYAVQIGDITKKDILVTEKEFEIVKKINIDSDGTRLAVIHN